MPSNKKVWAIVPAAGIGKRMSSVVPKQYLMLRGKPILEHTLNRLWESPCIDGVVVGVRNDDAHWETINTDHEKFLGISHGGKERIHTVLKAMDLLLARYDTARDDWVLVHDAVRPCVSKADIEKLVGRANANGEGALLAARVMDTLKRSDGDHRVEKTVERECHWRALTPQVFPLGTLKEALESAVEKGVTATDESAAMELFGAYPELVESGGNNIKITLKSDLLLAEFLLENGEEIS
ncbi:MAG: 2-C-methyl-D-erythritol 4-phosphate cytidylyltransferase [Gammaproteobacteria bacterium]|nr:2-C-methyl-D-erythritol 4-phosphate cytidylyltransferase [Gammaproteobacteria bacterium]